MSVSHHINRKKASTFRKIKSIRRLGEVYEEGSHSKTTAHYVCSRFDLVQCCDDKLIREAAHPVLDRDGRMQVIRQLCNALCTSCMERTASEGVQVHHVGQGGNHTGSAFLAAVVGGKGEEQAQGQ